MSLAAEQKFAVGADVREYELEANLSGRRFQDVYTIDPETGERKLALGKARWVMGASPDGTRLLHYNDGIFSAFDIAAGKSVDLTSKIQTNFWDDEDDHNVPKAAALARRLVQRQRQRAADRRLGHLDGPRPRRPGRQPHRQR